MIRAAHLAFVQGGDFNFGAPAKTSQFMVKLPQKYKNIPLNSEKVLSEFMQFRDNEQKMKKYLFLFEEEKRIAKERSTLLKELKATFKDEFTNEFQEKFPEYSI